MMDPSNVRRIPPQKSADDQPDPLGLHDIMGRFVNGKDWDRVKAEQRKRETMAQRRERITSALSYLLAISLMFWVILLGWAGVVWVLITLAEWRAS